MASAPEQPRGDFAERLHREAAGWVADGTISEAQAAAILARHPRRRGEPARDGDPVAAGSKRGGAGAGLDILGGAWR